MHYVRRLRMQDIDQGHLTLTLSSAGSRKGRTAVYSFLCRHRAEYCYNALSVRHYSQCDLHPRLEQRLALSVPEVKLWSPENPNLYDLTMELLQDGEVVDFVTTYFGMVESGDPGEIGCS